MRSRTAPGWAHPPHRRGRGNTIRHRNNCRAPSWANWNDASPGTAQTAVGWEEIRSQPGVSSDTWILSWQGVEAGQAAAEAGHPVVMTPAQHCYLDLAVSMDADDPGYYWAGTVDLRQAWTYDPTEGMSQAAAARVQGVQACLWTEIVTRPDEAEFMWFPRLLAVAEVAWGHAPGDSYERFESRARHWMSLLAHLGIAGRDERQGW